MLTGVDAKTVDLHHPALTVKPRLGSAVHVRRFFQISGLSLPNRYLVHNSSLANLVRGVLTRVFFVKGKPAPRPLDWIYNDRLGYFRAMLVRKFPSTTPIDRQQFVDYYRGRKRTIYQHAVDSLLSSSIKPSDATIKAFVKAEFINSDDKPDPDPRIISPRDPRYNVEVGRYLRPIEHRIYRGIDDIFGAPTVLKGYNAREIGSIISSHWNSLRNPVAIGLDASRFDQHVSVPALKWEHSVYNRIYNSSELRKLLKWQLRNNVKGYCRDGSLKYSVDGCRMSGDMNTAMGNCLIMCALVHCYAKTRGVPILLTNNGDDCTVFLERCDEGKFKLGLSEWFLEMGFNMKIEASCYDIENIEFCQTHPVFVDGGYLMVRNFQKSISKDCLSLKDLSSAKILKSWITAVGEGGLSLTGGVPVFQEFYSTLVKIGVGLPEVKGSRQNSKRRHNTPDMLTGGLSWLSKGMNRRYETISPRTRHSFYLAFGVTPDEQVELEGYYRSVIWNNAIVHLDRSVHLPRWA